MVEKKLSQRVNELIKFERIEIERGQNEAVRETIDDTELPKIDRNTLNFDYFVKRENTPKKQDKEVIMDLEE